MGRVEVTEQEVRRVRERADALGRKDGEAASGRDGMKAAAWRGGEVIVGKRGSSVNEREGRNSAMDWDKGCSFGLEHARGSRDNLFVSICQK